MLKCIFAIANSFYLAQVESSSMCILFMFRGFLMLPHMLPLVLFLTSDAAANLIYNHLLCLWLGSSGHKIEERIWSTSACCHSGDTKCRFTKFSADEY